MSNIFRLAEDAGEFVDLTDAKQVGRPLFVPEKITHNGGISGALWPKPRNRVGLTKQFPDQFTDISEHLEVAFSHDAISQALVFFALTVSL